MKARLIFAAFATMSGFTMSTVSAQTPIAATPISSAPAVPGPLPTTVIPSVPQVTGISSATPTGRTRGFFARRATRRMQSTPTVTSSPVVQATYSTPVVTSPITTAPVVKPVSGTTPIPMPMPQKSPQSQFTPVKPGTLKTPAATPTTSAPGAVTGAAPTATSPGALPSTGAMPITPRPGTTIVNPPVTGYPAYPMTHSLGSSVTQTIATPISTTNRIRKGLFGRIFRR